MVGYPVPLEANLNHVVQECAQPPQRACPATPIKSVDPENETVELQVLVYFFEAGQYCQQELQMIR